MIKPREQSPKSRLSCHVPVSPKSCHRFAECLSSVSVGGSKTSGTEGLASLIGLNSVCVVDSANLTTNSKARMTKTKNSCIATLGFVGVTYNAGFLLICNVGFLLKPQRQVFIQNTTPGFVILSTTLGFCCCKTQRCVNKNPALLRQRWVGAFRVSNARFFVL